MRHAHVLVITLAIAGGCLVPAYEATETVGSASGAGTAGAEAATAGNGATAGTSAAAGNGDGTECGPNQKSCAELCVDIDDPTYGCSPSSCNQSGCPAAGAAFACQDGACVISGCGAGSKVCDDKCVSVSDPTYGCSESDCDPSVCPDPGDGTLICNGQSCEVGSCTGDAKPCGINCVPPDANHGCRDPLNCDACLSNEICAGTPPVCACRADPFEACLGLSCGEAVDRCGATVQCTNRCEAPKHVCVENRCVGCVEPSDCVTTGNPCAMAACVNETCVYSTVGSGTSCYRGTCSNTGVCVRPAVDADGVSIDATEVTRGAYAQFLAAKGGSTSGQPSICSGNLSYESSWLDSPLPLKDYDLPMTGMDWCDAYAYCAWAGRKLCGSIGSTPLQYDEYTDPSRSQWSHACVGASNYQFPYGDTFDENKCNGPPNATGIQPVATFEQCVGVDAAVYDLSGNVSEWEDACEVQDSSRRCRVRGGRYYARSPDYAGDSSCNTDEFEYADIADPYLGFRCCGN